MSASLKFFLYLFTIFSSEASPGLGLEEEAGSPSSMSPTHQEWEVLCLCSNLGGPEGSEEVVDVSLWGEVHDVIGDVSPP